MPSEHTSHGVTASRQNSFFTGKPHVAGLGNVFLFSSCANQSQNGESKHKSPTIAKVKTYKVIWDNFLFKNKEKDTKKSRIAIKRALEYYFIDVLTLNDGDLLVVNITEGTCRNKEGKTKLFACKLKVFNQSSEKHLNQIEKKSNIIMQLKKGRITTTNSKTNLKFIFNKIKYFLYLKKNS